LFCGENNTFGSRTIVVALTRVRGRPGSVRTRRGSFPMKMTGNGSASIFLTLLMAAPIVGCHGDIGNGMDNAGGDNPDMPGMPAEPGKTIDGKPMLVQCSANVGRSPLRRLNRDEYRNTLHDLFPKATLASVYAKIDTTIDTFPLDEEKLGFTNN